MHGTVKARGPPGNVCQTKLNRSMGSKLQILATLNDADAEK